MTCFVTSKISFVKNENFIIKYYHEKSKSFFSTTSGPNVRLSILSSDLDGPENSRTGNFVDAFEFFEKITPVWNANPELCVLLCLHQWINELKDKGDLYF